MLFNTVEFVIFFIIILSIFVILKNRYFHHIFLLGASYLFFYLSSNYLITLLIFTTIFGFTSIMDGHKWAYHFEIFRGFLGLIIVCYPFELSLWQINPSFAVFLVFYFTTTIITTFWMYQSIPKRLLSS